MLEHTSTLLAIFNFPLDNNALESLHFWVQQFYGKWAFYGSTINTMDFSKCAQHLQKLNKTQQICNSLTEF